MSRRPLHQPRGSGQRRDNKPTTQLTRSATPGQAGWCLLWFRSAALRDQSADGSPFVIVELDFQRPNLNFVSRRETT